MNEGSLAKREALMAMLDPERLASDLVEILDNSGSVVEREATYQSQLVFLQRSYEALERITGKPVIGCRASDEQIAAEAGIKIERVPLLLDDMQRQGEGFLYVDRDGNRVIVSFTDTKKTEVGND